MNYEEYVNSKSDENPARNASNVENEIRHKYLRKTGQKEFSAQQKSLRRKQIQTAKKMQ